MKTLWKEIGFAFCLGVLVPGFLLWFGAVLLDIQQERPGTVVPETVAPQQELTSCEVSVRKGDNVERERLEEYLVGVVLAEMPASFEEEALKEIAETAFLANEEGEDIGARRLHAVFEELLEDISFNAGGDEMPDVYLNINAEYVKEHLKKMMNLPDPRKYIL